MKEMANLMGLTYERMPRKYQPFKCFNFRVDTVISPPAHLPSRIPLPPLCVNTESVYKGEEDRRSADRGVGEFQGWRVEDSELHGFVAVYGRVPPQGDCHFLLFYLLVKTFLMREILYLSRQGVKTVLLAFNERHQIWKLVWMCSFYVLFVVFCFL